MSLGTRLTLKTAVLVLAVVVVAGVALWGLGGLNRDLDAALGEYDKLREAYTLLSEIEKARMATRIEPPSRARVAEPLDKVMFRLDFRPSVLGQAIEAEVYNLLSDAQRALTDPTKVDTVAKTPAVTGPINSALNVLAAELSDISARIETIELRADRKRDRVVVWVTATAGVGVLLAIIVGVWQYLAVMRPLRRLQRGVERLASGDFADRLKASGDREFAQLANDFNRMADELATLYRELEDKVRLRSAQLAQSERLASVGFLAAGVAHEINNPLAIIAGEAELALGALPQDADDDLRQALTTTRDEAFRCKGITQKLLSLARPGSGTRAAMDLRQLADEVASLVKTLPQHEDRALLVQGDAVIAQTDPAPVKQVLLNLVINALEAVPAETGRVQLVVGEADGLATIAVWDNGKGLAPDALERVFEPFYTAKASPNTPGLGLGLSISHAIIEDLGGQLTAASPGPGQGSTFTIELPLDTSS